MERYGESVFPCPPGVGKALGAVALLASTVAVLRGNALGAEIGPDALGAEPSDGPGLVEVVVEQQMESLPVWLFAGRNVRQRDAGMSDVVEIEFRELGAVTQNSLEAKHLAGDKGGLEIGETGVVAGGNERGGVGWHGGAMIAQNA